MLKKLFFINKNCGIFAKHKDGNFWKVITLITNSQCTNEISHSNILVLWKQYASKSISVKWWKCIRII